MHRQIFSACHTRRRVITQSINAFPQAVYLDHNAWFSNRGMSTCRYLSQLRPHVQFGQTHPDHKDFLFYPNFFSLQEQTTLLQSALRKLDLSDPRASPRQRRKFTTVPAFGASIHNSSAIFLSEEAYTFEEGHFDGVIKHYREAHVTSWPPSDAAAVEEILHRLDPILPSPNVQIHVLHLAAQGEILPHVDNIEASGTWILGISLGATRILRMEPVEASDGLPFDAYLNPGSVYIQRDRLRFKYKHSILAAGVYDGKEILPNQRLSIMIRDRHKSARQNTI